MLLTILLCGAVWCEPLAAAADAAPAEPAPVVAFVVSGGDLGALAEVVRERDGQVTELPGLDAVRVEVPTEDPAATKALLEDAVSSGTVAIDPPVAISEVTPNDPAWASQWGLRTIAAPAAWTRSTGVATQVIAVLDTGVNPVADLSGRILPGIDLVNGDNDPADDHGGRHGTHVATVAAAAGNDGVGVAGVCWSCRVLPVKVLDANGTGYLSTVAAGVVWAADHGATVINLSLGGPSPSIPLQNAIDYANSRGVVVVGAAGNDGTSNPSYPAASAGVIAVAASNSASGLYSWSTRGATWVDVAAPGCNPSTGTGSPASFCGTSSATPMVAGVVALARSAAPGASSAGVRSALEGTTRPLSVTGLIRTGVVDADATLVQLSSGGSTTPPTAPVQADTAAPQVSLVAPPSPIGDIANFRVLATDDQALGWVGVRINGTLVATTSASGVSRDQVLAWNSRSVPDGWAVAEAVAVDAAGNASASAPTLVTVDNIGPTVAVSSPRAGRSVSGPFPVDVRATDTSGVRFVLLAAGGRWVGLVAGGGPSRVMVRPPVRGRITVTAIAVDNAGRIGISGGVAVTSKSAVGSRAIAASVRVRARR